MKLKPKSLHDAIFPIMILNWFTGLSSFEYPSHNHQLALSFFYVILSTSAYCYAYVNDPSKQILDRNEIRQNIFKLLQHANVFISTCCILLGWYNYKAFKIIIKRMDLLNEALESLGIPNNYLAVFMNFLLKTVMWIVMICTVISFDVNFFSQIFDSVKCLHLSYVVHYPVLLNSVVDLTFTSTVNHIGHQLDSINLLLKRILSKNPEPETVEELYKKHSRISALIMSTERSDILNNTERQKELIILIKHLHMELTEISFQVNQIYQIQITMLLTVFLVSLTGFLSILFGIILFVERTFPGNPSFILCMVAWCALYVYRLLNINSTCGKVSSKSRRTREILFEMKNTIQNLELKEEIEQFTLQLTQRPLIFSMCGFTTLDYPLVQAFMETLATYLVLLIYFSPEITG